MEPDRLPEPLMRAQQTFSDRTVAVLRDMVLSGSLRAGQRLNEVELAGALGISRGPLREAIQRLHSEGLLTSIANRGAFVRTFTPHELRELYEVRIALETHALRLAGTRPDAAAQAQLRELLDHTRRQLDGAQAYPRDLDFHQRIVALSGNSMLMQAAADVHRKIELARFRSAHEPGRARQAFAEHEELFEHLVAGRCETAVDLLARHLRASLDNALLILHSDADPFEPAEADVATTGSRPLRIR